MAHVGRDALEHLRRLPDDSVACFVTSPPYNVGHHHARSHGLRRWQGAYPGFADTLAPDDYVAYHRDVMDQMLRAVHPDGLIWWVHRRRPHATGRTELSLVDRVLEGFPVRSEIIWHKPNGGVFNLPHRSNGNGPVCYPANKYETIFLLAPSPSAGVSRDIALLGDVWIIDKERVAGFPAVYPVELARRCIRGTVPEGLIVDPFLGAGSTVLAARDLGRDAVGIELVPDTLRLAIRRIETTARPLFVEEAYAT